MAKMLTVLNNQIAPAGYITLTRPITIGEKSFTKIWAPLWDIAIKSDIPEGTKEADNPTGWVWHAVWKEKVIYYVDGAKIVDYVQHEDPFEGLEETWIPEPILLAMEKLLKEAKEKEKNNG